MRWRTQHRLAWLGWFSLAAVWGCVDQGMLFQQAGPQSSGGGPTAGTPDGGVEPGAGPNGSTGPAAGLPITHFGSGRDGDATLTGGIHALNRYSALAGDLPAGSYVATLALSGFAPRHNDLLMFWRVTEEPTSPERGLGGATESGRWELARVHRAHGNEIELGAPLGSSFPAAHSQVVRVPEFGRLEVPPGALIVPKPWDGVTGGIVAVLARGGMTLRGLVDASRAGFRGGVGTIDTATAVSGQCPPPDPVRPWGRSNDGQRGEGVLDGLYGEPSRERGGNGGGGGGCHNAGGAGGGHGGGGGPGGNTWDAKQIEGFPLGGQPGQALDYELPTRLSMGGGGGAGHANDLNTNPPGGGSGGGVVLLRVRELRGNGTIDASGGDGGGASKSGRVPRTDGGGGGGAGGAIVIETEAALECGRAVAAGGRGMDTLGGERGRHGPGGGGGGGRILFRAPGIPSCPADVKGGQRGTSAGQAHRAGAGQPGDVTTQSVPR